MKELITKNLWRLSQGLVWLKKLKRDWLANLALNTSLVSSAAETLNLTKPSLRFKKHYLLVQNNLKRPYMLGLMDYQISKRKRNNTSQEKNLLKMLNWEQKLKMSGNSKNKKKTGLLMKICQLKWKQRNKK